MLGRLISASVKGRIVVLALCGFFILFGLRTVANAPLDVFPEFAPVKVEIQTEAPGLSSEEVENLVTIPLEQAVNGTPKLTTLRSKSVLGLSSVVMLFDEGTDLHRARQDVQERMALAATRLPVVARAPVMLQPLSSLSRVLKIGLSSKTLSQMDMTVLTMWTIRPKLMSVPGVANVAVWGQRDKQLQVLVDPDRLRALNVTMDQVMKAAGDATVLESGGFVDTPNQRLAIRHASEMHDPDDLARALVDFRNGTPIRLGDVAEVKIGSPPPIGDAIINDGKGLLLIVEKQPAANTLDVTNKVEAALAEMKPGLKNVEIDSSIFRPATFIEMAIGNLQHALIIGAVLVVAILIAFLNNWRTAMISLMAIPVSLIFAIVVLTAFGVSLNTMVIAGLVIALGEVVDDAIIDVENIVRRLRLNREAGSPHSALKVVIDASNEVRSAVVYATAIVILVFLPVFFLDGIAGSFFKPLAMAYILAILASLIVALTITPALSYMLLTKNHAEKPEPRFAHYLRDRYHSILSGLLDKPRKALVIIAVALGLSGAGSLFFGHEFLPEFQETDFLMHFLERPGTSVELMNHMTIRASKELRAIPGVRNFGAHIGRAEVADEVVGPNFTELWISIDPKADYKPTLEKVQKAMHGYAGIFTDVQTYLKERSKEVLTGTSSSIVVRLFGQDMDILRAEADKIKHTMSEVKGVADLKVEPQVLVPQIEIKLRPDTAERYGLTPGHIRRVTTTLLRGSKIGEVYEGQQRFDVVVWGIPGTRADIAALQALPIDTPLGLQTRLSDVADVRIVGMPNEIKREAASRRIDITSNVKGHDLGSVAKEIEEKVRAMSFPQGYYPQFLGEYEAQQRATQRLLGFSILALMGIILIIYSDFKSWRMTGFVVFTLPFALVGGAIGVVLTGGTLSLGSVVGFITVLGIAARNGIMLISHYKHLEEREGMAFGTELVQRGCEERLIPILMTALATGLALLPLVIGGLKPGYEVEYPLAVVILGGLTTSTILNLFLLPPLYLAYGGRFKN